MTAAAPASTALLMKAWPSLFVPLTAMKRLPAFTSRESAVTLLMIFA